MFDCSHLKPGTLLFDPPPATPGESPRLSYLVAKPKARREPIVFHPDDRLIHLARWNHPAFDAMAECWEHGCTVAVGTNARITARLEPCSRPDPTGLSLRRRLFRLERDPTWCLETARNIIDAKIANQIALLVLYHDRPHSADSRQSPSQRPWGERYIDALQHLRNDRLALKACKTLDSLRGLEGNAARAYWECGGILLGMDAFRRSPRTCLDKANLVFDTCYARLAKVMTLVLIEQGFDPPAGILHVDAARPSLALDLMEPLRPYIADRFAIRLLRRPSDAWFRFDGHRWWWTAAGHRMLRDRWPGLVARSQKDPCRPDIISDVVQKWVQWLETGDPMVWPRIR